jgi:hypothetical protein
MNSLSLLFTYAVLSSGVLSAAPAANDGWIVLSDDLKAFQSPTAEWFVAGGASVSPKNERRLVGDPGRGTLINGPTGRTHNLVTKGQWGDLEVSTEFMIPPHSNSGIKLHGVYEIQIEDTWKTPYHTGEDCGGIYPRSEQEPSYHHIDEGTAPLVNAAKGPGEWQTFDIIFRAPRYDKAGKKVANARFEKVMLNGKLIHNNVEVAHPTGDVKQQEHAVGPLLLQADHGPVAFRNLRVRPLPPAAAPASKRE